MIREAARAAQSQPDNVRNQAFLLAIIVGLSDDEFLAQLPASASILGAIEPPSERTIRLKMLGEPTMHGRRDLAQHFLMSALLAATTNADAAQAAGLAKEFADAQGPSGFSFADIAADRAGARFARAVLDKRVPLGMLALAFRVQMFMPDVAGLPEKLSAKDLAAQFGNKDDTRFAKQLKEIDDRIMALTGLPAHECRVGQMIIVWIRGLESGCKKILPLDQSEHCCNTALTAEHLQALPQMCDSPTLCSQMNSQ